MTLHYLGTRAILTEGDDCLNLRIYPPEGVNIMEWYTAAATITADYVELLHKAVRGQEQVEQFEERMRQVRGYTKLAEHVRQAQAHVEREAAARLDFAQLNAQARREVTRAYQTKPVVVAPGGEGSNEPWPDQAPKAAFTLYPQEATVTTGRFSAKEGGESWPASHVTMIDGNLRWPDGQYSVHSAAAPGPVTPVSYDIPEDKA